MSHQSEIDALLLSKDVSFSPSNPEKGNLVKEVETPLPHSERATRSFIAHTPTPWMVRDETEEAQIAGLEPSGWVEFGYERFKKIGSVYMQDYPQNKANAAFIVKAVNAHDDLLAALKAIKQFGELGCVDASGHGYTGGKKPATKDVWQFPRHMLVEIDAAISKAESQS